MASCDLLYTVNCPLWPTCPYSPDAAQSDERDPRARCSAFSLDLIKYLSPLDEVGVTTERDHSRRAWWSLGSFGWKLKRGIDRAVDDAGLEAAVRIAKGDRRRHSAVAAEYASATVSAAKGQLVLSLALSLAISGSHLDQTQG